MDWPSRPTARGVTLPLSARNIYVSAFGQHASDPDGKTATILLWGYRENGPAQYIATLGLTVGKQPVRNLPIHPFTNATAVSKWVDSISITAEKWSNSLAIINHAADLVAMAKFVADGISFLVAEVSALSADTTLTVVFTYNDP
jgi:hypothetical protein